MIIESGTTFAREVLVWFRSEEKERKHVEDCVGGDAARGRGCHMKARWASTEALPGFSPHSVLCWGRSSLTYERRMTRDVEGRYR